MKSSPFGSFYTDIDAAVTPPDEKTQNAMFSNAKLRLLMTLVKLERLGMEDVAGAQWVVPSVLTSQDIKNTKSMLDQCIDKPIAEDRDPRELLRRKYGGDTRSNDPESTVDVNFGSDSEGEDDIPDGFLFPPNLRSKSSALDELKKKRKEKRNQDGEKEPLDDETLEARRQTRLENARARQAKIKSDLFIHASDEESDEEDDQEFFRLEEERRKAQAERVKKALLTGDLGDGLGKKKGGRKRKSDVAGAQNKRQRRRPQAETSGGSDDNEDSNDDILMTGVGDDSAATEKEDSPAEDPRPEPEEDDLNFFDDDLAFGRDSRKDASADSDDQDDAPISKTADADAGDAEDEDAQPTAPGRRRMRAGFVIESDSE